jgi:type II secretory pathway pseudopilin PulG
MMPANSHILACRQPRRRAFTLADIAVVVALISILLSIVVAFLVRLQQYDATLRDNNVRTDRVAQLAEALRADIRQASAVSLPDRQTLLVAASESRQIQFALTAEGCRRTVSGPDDAMPVIDLYRIGPTEGWSLESGPQGRRTLYLVTLFSHNETETEPLKLALFVQAALGADLMENGSERD